MFARLVVFVLLRSRYYTALNFLFKIDFGFYNTRIRITSTETDKHTIQYITLSNMKTLPRRAIDTKLAYNSTFLCCISDLLYTPFPETGE
jgi:hypothetical protein